MGEAWWHFKTKGNISQNDFKNIGISSKNLYRATLLLRCDTNEKWYRKYGNRRRKKHTWDFKK